jgi:uncharacterized 2Fe-2S/4Fe-4S cluster protein (DUF4445 family)
MNNNKKVKVTFYPKNITAETEEGENLLRVAMSAGVHINASCGGAGTCGKCKVKIDSGEVKSEITERLSDEELDEGYRLACITTVESDLSVSIPVESLLDKSVLTIKSAKGKSHIIGKAKLSQLCPECKSDSVVVKLYIELPKPSAEDNMNDLDRVKVAVKKQFDLNIHSTDFAVIKKMSKILRNADWNVTITAVLTSAGSKCINIQEGDTTKENYSLVIDVGTTSVYVEILDVREGTTVAEGSDYNSQISYGEDVISRIIYSQKEGGLKTLQDRIISTINGIIDELLKESGIDKENITHLVAAGNTTMTQILLGLDPKYIREAPYIPVANFVPPVRAASLGINIGNNAYLYTFPVISSYVGGDITSGVLGTGIFKHDEVTMYIDVGTNGEIVLGNKDWLVTTSCSAGPAFEGGGVKYGMRATKGAIEQIRIQPETYEPMILVIGNVKPKGICGSAMIDVVAELLEVGLIDQNGKFYRDKETDWIREGESGYEYVLARAEETQINTDITINEVDIENLIRTKAAIYSGCVVLLNNVGYTFADIDKFIIAGGFGHYIDVERGISIGLLPEIDINKFTFIGNGSLLGARLVSLTKDTLKDASNIAKTMTNIELANNKMFMDEYISAMFLPHTNIDSFKKTMARLEELWSHNKDKEKGVCK